MASTIDSLQFIDLLLRKCHRTGSKHILRYIAANDIFKSHVLTMILSERGKGGIARNVFCFFLRVISLKNLYAGLLNDQFFRPKE